MVTVAAGSGYWRDYAPGLRRVAPLLWFAAGGLPAAAVYRFANTADAAKGNLKELEAVVAQHIRTARRTRLAA